MRRSVLWLALILGGSLPGLAAADWMREYDRGLKAIKDGDWATAETHFRAAMRERRDPNPRQRFQGQRFEAYVPQHWAGYAAWQRGECATAIEYWQTTGLESALREDKGAGAADRLADRQRGLAECSQRLAGAAAPQRAAAETATEAAPVATPIAAQPVASRSVEPPARAPSRPAPPVESAPRPLAGTPAASPASGSTAAPAAGSQANVASAAPAREPSARATALDPALGKAVDAYLAGRYAELERIELPAAGEAAARAQVLLLRAAARYIAAELDAADPGALEAVRGDIRAARAAQAGISPDAVMFPPRFRSFWQQTR
jgi:hypothetical protein